MEIHILMLLWITVLVFTVAAFIYPKTLYLPILCFALWNSMALYVTDVDIIGFGSQNVITQGYEIGDPELPTYIMWFFHGIGLAMLVYGIGNYMEDIHKTGKQIESGRANTIIN